ncbi:Cys-Xaa-Xaa-Xaa repeat radical SAM target protein [Duncaniella muris]|uniref:Cys-Xaa-Xaa-Xaa repeat radical SAM target protein n=1 Tax=Duncaniella muris TaxID=2094150 RepID=UPI003F67947E
MSEKSKKEELQTRRQFFKSAAKAALPILGAAIISATPLNALASQSDSSRCDWGCTGGCSSSCSGGCSGSCGGACSYNCQNTCSGSCQGCRGCSGSCSYSCSTTCSGGCRSGNVY